MPVQSQAASSPPPIQISIHNVLPAINYADANMLDIKKSIKEAQGTSNGFITTNQKQIKLQMFSEYINSALQDLYGTKALGDKYISGLTSSDNNTSQKTANSNIDNLIELGNSLVDTIAETRYLERRNATRVFRDRSLYYTGEVILSSNINPIELSYENNRSTFQVSLNALHDEFLVETHDDTPVNIPPAHEPIFKQLLLAPYTELTMKKAQLILYRMVDSINKFITLPSIRTITAMDSKSFNSSIDDATITKIIDKLAGPDTYFKKAIQKTTTSNPPVALPLTDQIIPDDKKYGSHHRFKLLSNKTIRIMSLMNKTIDRIYFDLYTAYPDRPLPAIAYTSEIEGSIPHNLVAMQIFTTPDFFIKRDLKYIRTIVEDINGKVDAAKNFLSMEEIKSERTQTTAEIDKKKLINIASTVEKDLTEKSTEIEFQVLSLVNEMTKGIPTRLIATDEGLKKDPEVADACARAGASITDFVNTIRNLAAILSNNSVDINQRLINAMQELKDPAGTDNEAVAVAVSNYKQIDRKLIKLQTQAAQTTGLANEASIILSAKTRIAANPDSKLSSSETQLIKSLINPSAGAYAVASMDIMQQKLFSLVGSLARNNPISTMAMAFPTFKFYIIEEDAKEWLFFNDFYDYGAVKQLRVHKNRKDASETAYIELSNLYGRLTNVIAGNRSKVENPFFVRPDDEEEVNSMMLKVGARIQIRMGYSAHLGAEAIVFSGRIQELQGTHTITIVAQSHGVELTREIGTGEGKNYGGFLDRLQTASGRQAGSGATNTALGLVSTILNEADAPLRGLGTLSPYLGITRLRNVANSAIDGLGDVSQIKDPYLSSVLKWTANTALQSLLPSLDVSLLDTRLSNVNMSSASSGWSGFFTTLLGRSRWLIFNETIWDSLQDFILQTGNRICTVRSFDEDNTLVIDTDDGVYQRSLEDFNNVSHLYPIIKQFEKGEASAVFAVQTLRHLILNSSTVGAASFETAIDNPSILNIFIIMIRSALSSLLGEPTKISASDTRIPENFTSMAQTLARRYVTGEGYGTLLTAAEEYDSASLQHINETKAQITAASKGTDVIPPTASDIPPQLTGFLYCICEVAPRVCTYLKQVLVSSEPSFRTVSKVHIKTAVKDIVKNNIKTVAGFNRVDLSYLEEDLLGTLITFTGMGALANSLGLTSIITVDNINTPSKHTNIFVSASQTIEYERVNTYATFQKNAAVRGSIIIDNPIIVANSILANLVRDYYDGELIILMDPDIEPYDVVFIHDDVNDMWGMIQVKEVTHSFSPETGAVTVIRPDMYVRNELVGGRRTYDANSWRTWTKIGTDVVLPIVGFFVGAGIGKIVAKGVGAVLTNMVKPARLLVAARIGTKFEKAIAGEGNLDDVFKGFTNGKVSKILNNTNEGKSFWSSIAKKLKFKDTGEVVTTFKKPADAYRQVLDELDSAIDSTQFDAASGIDSNTLKQAIARVRNKINDNTDLPTALKAVADELPDATHKKAYTDAFAKFMQKDLTEDSAIIKEMIVYFTRNNFIDDWMGPTSIFRNALSIKLLPSLIGTTISSRIGRQVIPNFQTFSAHLGEYFNQNPITVAGLIHKGEPLVANLDGMRKHEFNSATDWLEYKVKESFNPLWTLIGDAESVVNQIEQNPYKDIFQ